MEFLFNMILLVVGFILLIKGADTFVDGSSNVAKKFKVPKMLIGLTIVSFGTSAPELAVSIQSILAGKGDILLGNVVGSNILNILLILGLSSLAGVLHVNAATVKKELPVLVLITMAFSVILTDRIFGLATNDFTRQDGIVILLFFCIFIYYLIGMARRKNNGTTSHNKEENKIQKVEELKNIEINKEGEEVGEEQVKIIKALAMVFVGLIGIVFGSDLVVKSASTIASIFNVSQRLISLTIVALGTSLPELVTSVMATKKGEYDIAIGNIVGSNIFNIGIVAGLPVAIFGGVAGRSFSYIDISMMLISAIVLFFFARHGGRIGYKKGIIFLLMFVVYYTYVILN